VSNATATADAAGEGAGGAGAALLRERRRQGLSIGDVSRQLKLSVRQIEALERDDYSAYKGPVFIHGFIRNYAKLLGLDPEPLIRATDSMLNPPVAHSVQERERAPRADPLPQDKPRRWPAFAALALIAVALLSYLAGRPRPDGERNVPAVAARDNLAPPAQSPGADVRAKAETKAPADAAVRKSPGKPATHAETKSPPSAAASPTADAQSDPDSGADAGARVKVRMIFEEESWVEIKDRAGNTVFGQLNPAGSRRSVSAEPPLSVVVGHAAGVRMFVGDKPVDLAPHTRVDVARLTLE
jgi:cytoskeleton protein RodZ